ncbi:beta-propeller domain-containing protein [Phosphitispora sp. TUW77]|uniref:beta-propeller domain-containing protein n=1 Tax=Phosphitispora sp. TUW77 TaxID=3152361 RepID=UPI003AB55580
MNKAMLRIYPVLVMLVFLMFTAPLTSSGIPKPPDNNPSLEATPLPVIGSLENLKEVLKDKQSFSDYLYNGIKGIGMKVTVDEVESRAAADEASSINTEFSATNVQVSGVDEADIIKTDGTYIYLVNNQRVIIVHANPASEMKVINTINFNDENFMPQELYVDDKYLTVIGHTRSLMPFPQSKHQAGSQIECPPIQPYNTIKTIIYDISNRKNIQKLRETELEGQYVSSRKIASALYLVVNKHIDYYYLMEQQEANADNTHVTPAYRDSAGTGNFTGIDFSDIKYFPEAPQPNYLMVAGLNLDEPEKEMELSTYLGSGENIYASDKNLYVAVSRSSGYQNKANESGTIIYKFELNDGHTKYLGKGEVPGTILNQFSMDEYNGYFRIATTKGEVWRNNEYTSKNNLYVLDNSMQVTGKIEDIAPGEKIYSVGFMGDRGYMVTFKKVDPLFVLDLKEPQSPRILGALKIPGYSDYLHPYDENHIIGFGKDTVEMGIKDPNGNESGTMAYYQGMKIAVFDVTDVEHPMEKFKEIIGDRGTDSELLRNHKALLFSKERNLLAFPVTVMELGSDISSSNRENAWQTPEYGQFTFQGAYIYNLDLIDGFALKGKITHIPELEMFQAGNGWYNSNKNVERIIYIGDTLFTISSAMIKAHDINLMVELNSLEIR